MMPNAISRPLEGNQVLAASRQETRDVLLHSAELDKATALALKMVEERSECREALAATLAALVGAVVERGLVDWAADMLFKGSGGAELAVADVALVAATIVSRAGVPS
jgi:hypothetical protein